MSILDHNYIRQLFLFIFLTSALSFSISALASNSLISHEDYFTANPYQGTVSCLECHMQAAQDILTTGHWNWQGLAENVVDAEHELHGKNDFINNFCVAVPGNEGRCTQCHIGYGYKDKSFDFTNADNIDCLICHDQTGTYKKGAKTAGMPDPAVDLQLVAKSVDKNDGVPGRDNCIFCHAYAGGGDNVKHGDLAMSLANTTREYDVHMGSDGADMRCVDCHDVDRDLDSEPVSHGIGGMAFHSVDEGSMKQCVDCHGKATRIHRGKVRGMIRKHDRLACQVCHIPAIARETSTKVEWYWADAGQDIDPVPVDPVTGRATYDKKKGTFVWALNVRPVLRFHNGKWNKKMINTNDYFSSEPVDLASPAADRNDPDAMIYPFKKMIGNQIADADPSNTRLLVPHLFGLAGGDYPYWGVFDWEKALWDGSIYNEQFFSGVFNFVNTEMLLAVNHEIAPKENSLGANGNCRDCHAAGLIDWQALGWQKDPYPKKHKGMHRGKRKGRNNH